MSQFEFEEQDPNSCLGYGCKRADRHNIQSLRFIAGAYGLQIDAGHCLSRCKEPVGFSSGKFVLRDDKLLERLSFLRERFTKKVTWTRHSASISGATIGRGTTAGERSLACPRGDAALRK